MANRMVSAMLRVEGGMGCGGSGFDPLRVTTNTVMIGTLLNRPIGGKSSWR